MKTIKKTITHKHIFDALKKERLTPGNWFREDSNYSYNKPDCKVCLVGGVLRQASFTAAAHRFKIRYGKQIIDGIDQLFVGASGFNANISAALERKQYLRALSIQFEKFSRTRVGNMAMFSVTLQGEDLAYVQKHMTDWVKKNIPTKFEIESKVEV